MKERPILFSSAMILALLENRKRQTRRVVKGFEITGPNPPNNSTYDAYREGDHPQASRWVGAFGRDGKGNATSLCPYGVPGDRLWVKEAWRFINMSSEDNRVCIGYEADGPELPNRPDIHVSPEWITRLWEYKDIWSHRKRSSMHMPRWASRITLEITEVRVERLQDISDADAKAEGVEVGQRAIEPGFTYSTAACIHCGDRSNRHVGRAGGCYSRSTLFDPKTFRGGFKFLWSSIHKADGPNGWDADPWVWVVEFRRLA